MYRSSYFITLVIWKQPEDSSGSKRIKTLRRIKELSKWKWQKTSNRMIVSLYKSWNKKIPQHLLHWALSAFLCTSYCALREGLCLAFLPISRDHSHVSSDVTSLLWTTRVADEDMREELEDQFSSVVQSYPTVCDPMDGSTPGLPVHHQLPEFTQTHVHRVSDAIQTSYPLSPPSPPAFNLSQQQGLFKWVSSSHQVAKILEFQLQHQSFQWIFRTDFL